MPKEKLTQIKKRDGRIMNFAIDKITGAIFKTLRATGKEDYKLAEKLSGKVAKVLDKKFNGHSIPSVEQVQDVVEEVLIKEDMVEAAKAYILYREQHAKIRDLNKFINSDDLIDQYLNKLDWRVKENSNMAYSLQGLNNHVASTVSAHYWLNAIYPPEIRDAHINADLHIHDLQLLAAYCCGWDILDLLIHGFTGAEGKVQSKPPKHFRSALGMVVNFLYTLQGEANGAQAFSSFDTYLAPFIRYDKLDYPQVKQAMQEFMFNMNIPTRVGFQCMSEDTEILTENGWQKYNQVKKGDTIATFNIEKEYIEYLPVRKMFAKKYKGTMYNLKNRISDQLISPKHRVVRRRFGSYSYVLEPIEKALGLNSPFIVPVGSEGYITGESSTDEDVVKLISWVVAEGTFDKGERGSGRISIYQSREKNTRDYNEIVDICNNLKLKYSERVQKGLGANCNVLRFDAASTRKILSYFKSDRDKGIKFIPESILRSDAETARLFLETYIKGDGHDECKITTASKKIKDGLLHIAANAGYGATVLVRKPDNNLSKKDRYIIRLIKHRDTYINTVKKINYEGIIWCPNTKNETVIARRNGKIFITGNTPFTNITMDLKPSGKLAEDFVVIGGKVTKDKYKDFQPEIDMFNRAFAEVCIEGDAKGRVFTFPIPTYNITKNLDWDNKVLDPVWEMTAKYGIPYFCLDQDTQLITDKGVKKIKDLTLKDKVLDEGGQFKTISLKKRIQVTDSINLVGDNFNIVCSHNHRFPTSQGLKIAAELSLNDKLLQFNEELILENGLRLNFQNSHFFDLSGSLADLSKQSFINLKPKKQIKQLPEFKFKANRFQTTLNQGVKIPRALDSELMEIIGIILGDGSIQPQGIKIVNADKEIISFVTRVVKDKFNLKTSIRPAGKSSICKEISFNSVILIKFLESIGLSGNTYNKRIPEICYWQGQKEIGALLRGLFDTDGSISLNRRKDRILSIAFSNPQLVNDVLLLLAKIGIIGKLDKRQRISITGSRNIKFFAQYVNFRIKRKRDRLSYPVKISQQPSIGDRIYSVSQAAKFNQHYKYKNKNYVRVKGDNTELYLFISKYNKQIVPVGIDKIQVSSEKKVMYDVTVESKKHLFVLQNGIISHNSNFINSDMNPDDVRSMCCRLRLNNNELRKRGGGLFGANPLTGSIGVVTINLPRIGYLAKDKEDYFKRLDKLMYIARESLEVKREVIEKFTNMGLYPYSRFYLGKIKEQFGEYWKNHFNTIGILGMNESLINFIGEDITTKKGNDLAIEIMEHMRDLLGKFQEETNNLYNLEATPGEGTTYRFAKSDKKKFADIIVANEEAYQEKGAAPYYTNSSQLPVNYSADIFEALDLQDDLQTKYTGGTVLHGFVGERMPSIQSTKNLVKKIAENYSLPYYTITPTFSICPIHGYLAGEHEFCPKCDEEIGYSEDIDKLEQDKVEQAELFNN